MRPLTRWLLLVLPGMMAVVGAGASIVADVPLASDPVVYLERVRAIEAGGRPYLDPVFEHLPGMLVPMFVARWLTLAGSVESYVLTFGLLMVLCLWVSGRLVARMGRDPDRIALRWLAVVAPLTPLVTFRNDPWVVMWALSALAPQAGPLLRGFGSVVAVLSKGWPVGFALLHWREGRRAVAVLTSAAGVVAVGLMATKGFRSSQQGAGLHSESLAGSAVGLWRSLRGDDLELILTTAAYIDVPSAAHWVGPMVAVVLASAGALAVWRSRSFHQRFLATGLLTVSVIMASRLFSAQYVLWLAPFVALSRRRSSMLLGVLMSTQAVYTVFDFFAIYDSSVLWWGGAMLRNLAMLALGSVLLVEWGRSSVLQRSEAMSEPGDIVGPSRR